MTKDRFLELLNLYLDHEISLEEEGEFMRELRFNPERYELYLEYCQMNNACVAIGKGFIQPRRRVRNWRQSLFAAGGIAATVALLALSGRNLVPLFAPEAVEPQMNFAQKQSPVVAVSSPIFEMEPELIQPLAIEEANEPGIQFTSTSAPVYESFEEVVEEVPAWKKGLVLSSDPGLESLDHELLLTVENPMQLDAERLAGDLGGFKGISEKIEFDFAKVSFGEKREFNIPLEGSREK
ncbi:MAG: hypothetical protein AAGB46_17785 [Verrucomicrobiota bacterium]